MGYVSHPPGLLPYRGIEGVRVTNPAHLGHGQVVVTVGVPHLVTLHVDPGKTASAAIQTVLSTGPIPVEVVNGRGDHIDLPVEVNPVAGSRIPADQLTYEQHVAMLTADHIRDTLSRETDHDLSGLDLYTLRFELLGHRRNQVAKWAEEAGVPFTEEELVGDDALSYDELDILHLQRLDAKAKAEAEREETKAAISAEKKKRATDKIPAPEDTPST